ncbi:BRO1-domain-containing protein [Trichodelitschia bisporula]|uniref:BRO1-domain-containing protein n=1 Tax=Trichodelitschia bisporula TaxID=703511 RepID=A0A6G1HT05_9PEZI|nr:BRO1-domain-containing protein [Trichodelitschia bisporula]
MAFAAVLTKCGAYATCPLWRCRRATNLVPSGDAVVVVLATFDGVRHGNSQRFCTPTSKMAAISNILFLSFRRTHALSFNDAIKQYISTKYDQHPDMFARDLQTIDELRREAAHALEPHVSGIKKLQAYAAQLVWLGGKFPIDIGVEFTWYPALGYNTQRPISQNNIRFELANVLYNLASMYSQLAYSANRSTQDGLKAAANYFCLSAGVVHHLTVTVIPELRSSPPEDMDIMTLESLERLLLAQAQECFWQKAVKDNLKDLSISKLAAKVSDLYSEAGEFGVKSDAISSEWIHHMNAKHHHFAAAAQLRAALDCLEKRRYGEEVARLKDSLSCVTEALREARYISKAVLSDLNGLKNRIQEDLKRAEKDNDMIYLQPEPPKSELKLLERRSMVAPKVPPQVSDPLSALGEDAELGPLLFTKLVPYAVHVAASIYADRRDRLVNQTIIGELETMTGQLHEVLKSLNLPGSLQAIEKPLGLPPGLVSHAEEIRQQDGPTKLAKSLHETEKLKDADQAIYQEGVELLRSEAAEDERARLKYGTERWTRPTSQEAALKLYADIGEISGYFRAADGTDETVQAKLRENEALIRLLAGSDRDLERFVPSSRRPAITVAVDQAAGKLRGCLNDIGRLESRRRRKIEEIRAKAKADDINPALLQEAARLEREMPMQKIEAGQFEHFFDRQLQAYDADKAVLAGEEREQREIIRRLQEANAAFTSARKGDSTTKDRERALQQLENAYMKYKEIITNLNAGRTFYNDLAKIVTRFRDGCRTFAYQRRSEASQMESYVAPRCLNLNQVASLQQQKQAEVQSPSYAARAPQPEPLTAPQPTRSSNATPGMWTPQVGIRFAQGGAPPSGAQSGQTRGGQWDQTKSLKFS